jgi:hypothetical protein
VAHAIELELARSLVEVAGDRPAAVARVRRIPPGIDESFEARFFEGRWRADLGDLAGAAVALGRLRDEVERAPGLAGDRAAAVAALLVEAAHIEERDRGDLPAAQRHLGLALRLRPRDRAIAASFRRVAGEVARAATISREAEAAHEADLDANANDEAPPPASAPGEVTSPELDLAQDDEGAPSEDAEARGISDEALAERLTDRVRANPQDHEAVVALADALERLGRRLDLLALLSARIEEGDDEVRRELGPRRRAVLVALAEEARAEGRASEAELYEMMASAEPD